MKNVGEIYRVNLIIAGAIRMSMFLPDRPVNWTWKRIDRLPKMSSRIVKDPAERN